MNVKLTDIRYKKMANGEIEVTLEMAATGPYRDFGDPPKEFVGAILLHVKETQPHPISQTPDGVYHVGEARLIFGDTSLIINRSNLSRAARVLYADPRLFDTLDLALNVLNLDWAGASR